MNHLFEHLTIGQMELSNRIVMSPMVSGFALPDGFISEDLYNYYLRRAHGGVGLIISEPILVAPPVLAYQNHLGLYADFFIPQIRRLVRSVHGGGAKVLLLLDAPAEMAEGNSEELANLAEDFIRAAWRALATECDGIMLSSANGGIFHTLLSPILNKRLGDNLSATNRLNLRIRLPIEIIENIYAWLGEQIVIGFRLVAEDFTPGGISLHDARIIAQQLVTVGIKLLDVTADMSVDAPVVRFPGWCVPLATGIKRAVPNIPIIGSGQLGDPRLANSVVREGSLDLVMLNRTLRLNPYWPHIARIILQATIPE